VDKDSIEFAFNHKIKINNINLNSLYDDYNTLLNEYIKALEKNNKNFMIEISKKLSLYENLLRIQKILKTSEIFENKIFLPFSFDFRGRLYYKSALSPTFFVEIRYSIYKGYYENDGDINIISNKYFSKIIKTLNDHVHLVDHLAPDLKPEQKHAIIWILIFISETAKTKIGKNAHISQFIHKGLEILKSFNDNPNQFNYDDFIKISHANKVLNEMKIKKMKK
jgi:hypothetical protein